MAWFRTGTRDCDSAKHPSYSPLSLAHLGLRTGLPHLPDPPLGVEVSEGWSLDTNLFATPSTIGALQLRQILLPGSTHNTAEVKHPGLVPGQYEFNPKYVSMVLCRV